MSFFFQFVAHAISEHVENAAVHSGFTNNQRGGYPAGTKVGGADHVLLATDRSVGHVSSLLIGVVTHLSPRLR